MPAFFIKTTDNGILVSNKRLASKEVTLKDGKKRMMSIQQTDVKIGFFGCENPKELGYEKGEQLPVSLSASQVVTREGEVLNLFWCNPD